MVLWFCRFSNAAAKTDESIPTLSGVSTARKELVLRYWIHSGRLVRPVVIALFRGLFVEDVLGMVPGPWGEIGGFCRC